VQRTFLDKERLAHFFKDRDVFLKKISVYQIFRVIGQQERGLIEKYDHHRMVSAGEAQSDPDRLHRSVTFERIAFDQNQNGIGHGLEIS
jgi:hypothetical protein